MTSDVRGTDAAKLEKEFATELETIISTSTLLTQLDNDQAVRAQQIQALCGSVWTVVQQQYSISGKTGDQQQYTVNHQYSQEVAVVDASKYDALNVAMGTHLTIATSDVASARFKHALAEERLQIFALGRILSAERARLLSPRNHAPDSPTHIAHAAAICMCARVQVRPRAPRCCGC